MSQVELEHKTGIKREYLSKIENAELKNPTYNTLLKICSGLGISLTDLVEAEKEPQLRKEPPLKVAVEPTRASQVEQAVKDGRYVAVPLIGQQTAARGAGHIDVEEIEQYLVIAREYLTPTTDTSRFRCVRLAKGDYSMSPVMEPEAIVGIDSYQTDPYQLDGKLVLLRLSDTECGVRQVKLEGNYMIAIPSNLKEYNPIILSKSKKHRLLGRVVWCLNRFS
jgi:DNA-binding Xre family transcriptional regulator